MWFCRSAGVFATSTAPTSASTRCVPRTDVPMTTPARWRRRPVRSRNALRSSTWATAKVRVTNTHTHTHTRKTRQHLHTLRGSRQSVWQVFTSSWSEATEANEAACSGAKCRRAWFDISLPAAAPNTFPDYKIFFSLNHILCGKKKKTNSVQR